MAHFLINDRDQLPNALHSSDPKTFPIIDNQLNTVTAAIHEFIQKIVD